MRVAWPFNCDICVGVYCLTSVFAVRGFQQLLDFFNL